MAEREKQAVRTAVQADSIEELLEKISNTDWNEVAKERS